MPKHSRISTKYQGVFFIEGQTIGGDKPERIYYVRYRKDGKQVEEKAGRSSHGMTPARASNLRAERMAGKRQTNTEKRKAEEERKQAEPGRWTFDKLWAEYKAQKAVYKGKGPDQNRYKNYLQKPFSGKEPKELLPLDVDRVRMKMLKAGKSPQTVKLTLALLRRLANFGAKKRLCEGLRFIIEMPVVNNIKTEDVSADQLGALLRAIDADDHPQAGALMKMVLYTGMRRGELFRLKWKDIDEQRGFIKIRDPKGGVDQTIPLNDAARDLLQKHPSTGSPYVFPGRNGNQRTDIHHQVNRIRDRAGLPKDFRALHGLRHVYMRPCWHLQGRLTCTRYSGF